MNVTELYPSTYLKAADLGGTRHHLTISKVELADVGSGEMKPVIHFLHKDRGLVLNKTNAFIIAEAYGVNTDSWPGKSITLYSHQVNFQGKIVDGVAVIAGESAPVAVSELTSEAQSLEALQAQVKAMEAEKSSQEAAAQAATDDDIPF